MKINIAQIQREGLSLHESYETESLDLNTSQINFISPIEVSAGVVMVSDRILIEVEVRGLMRLACSRCLEEFEKDFFKEFKFDYPAEKDKQVLDITDDIRQEISLSYPVKFLCKEDCRGLCPVCGQNLNKELCRHREKTFLKRVKKGGCSHALT